MHEPVRVGNDHRADRIRALDMAVVVNLDAVQRPIETQGGRHPVEQLALRCAFGETAAERLPRRRVDAIDKLFLVAALRHREGHLLAAQRERLLDELLLDQPMAQQDQPGFGAVVVKLADKGTQHLLD